MKTAKLNFPVIKKPLPIPKSLSMDEYLSFVSFNIKYAFDRKAYRNWKKISAVNTPFVLSIIIIFGLLFVSTSNVLALRPKAESRDPVREIEKALNPFIRDGNIIDGKAIAAPINESLEPRVKIFRQKRGFVPKAVIIASEDNLAFPGLKKKTSQEVGIDFEIIPVLSSSTADDILKMIAGDKEKDEKDKGLNGNDSVQGIVIQSPLAGISLEDEKRLMNSVDYTKDIDGQGDNIVGKIINADFSPYITPTAQAVMEVLDKAKLKLSGKRVVLLGPYETDAKVLEALFKLREVKDVQVVDPATNFKEATQEADVLVTFINRPKEIKINAGHIKKGAVVIDLGWAQDTNGVTGDVDIESIKGKAGLISPAVGGVNLVSRSIVAVNTLRAATYIWGAPIASARRESTKIRVAVLKEQGITPTIALLAGKDAGAQWYKGAIIKEADEAGINCLTYDIEGYSQKQVEDLISKLNDDPNIHGILPLTKLPDGVDLSVVANTISLKKDIDGMNLPPLFETTKGESASKVPDDIVATIKMELAKRKREVGDIDVALIGRNKWAFPLALKVLQKSEGFSSVKLINPGDESTIGDKENVVTVDFSKIQAGKILLLDILGETVPFDISERTDDVDFLIEQAPLLDPGSNRKASNTPEAAITILESVTAVKGKKIAVIGRGKEGLPVALRLFALGAASVEIIHTETKNTKEKVLRADIIVSAVGFSGVVTSDMVSSGAIVIDIATVNIDKPEIFKGRSDKPKETGSVAEDVVDIAAAVTPVPGGVGLVTTVRLLEALVDLIEQTQREN